MAIDEIVVFGSEFKCGTLFYLDPNTSGITLDHTMFQSQITKYRILHAS